MIWLALLALDVGIVLCDCGEWRELREESRRLTRPEIPGV